MCRMVAVTATNVDPKTLFILIDRGLISSIADDKGQVDGYGIATSDGILVKDAGSYRDAELWFTPSKMKTPIIGHIRAASVSTGRTEKEAHPYFFDKAKVPFLFQHNGNVATSFGIAQAPYPATDSYAAGQALEKLVNTYHRLDASVLLEWAKQIKETNPFVFFILANDTLYILRGNKERTMFYLAYQDGFIFHTNPHALLNIVSYCLQLGITTFEPQTIQEVPEKTLYVVRGGSIEQHSITLLKEDRCIVPFYTSAWTDWYANAVKRQEQPTTYPLFLEEKKDKAKEDEWTALSDIFQIMTFLGFHPTITLASFVYKLDPEIIMDYFLELLPKELEIISDNVKKWNKIVRRDTEYAFLKWIESNQSSFAEELIPVYSLFSEQILQEVYTVFLEGGNKRKKEDAAGNAAKNDEKEESR